MGACSGKSKQSEPIKMNQDQQALAKDKFEIGPEIFVNLKLGDISASYSISKILGEGSYGQVRLVVHKQTGQQRAMKQIQKAKIQKDQEEAMFSEVSLLKQMDHPNILRIYELYQDEKNYYLVTEFLTGGELLEKITATKQLSEKTAAEYMKQILNALSYCHQKHIIHRDLKPANILFESKEPNASLKIIDFGTAKQVVSGEKQGQVIGTPLYIAPEVIQKSYTEKCDIWSCGVMLYQILTGKFPFSVKVDSLQALFKNIKSGQHDYTCKEFTAISHEGQTIIKEMLNMNPEARPSAAKLLENSWFKSNSTQQLVNPEVMTNLGKFNNENQLRAAVLQLIVSQVMSNQEKQCLVDSFQTMDINKDGLLSKDELEAGYIKTLKDETKARFLVEQIFSKADVDNSGKLSYTEFVVAATEQSKLLSKARVEQTFKMFDTDGNGVITKKEIQEMMCGVNLEQGGWDPIMKQIDANGDGQISHDEFVNLLLTNIK